MRDTGRASLISFTALSQVLQPLISDKGTLASAIDKLQNDDGWHSGVSGTNGRKGLEIARDTLAVSPQNSKAIFFMTDGDDTELTGTSYSDLADQFHAQGTVVYVFLLGPQISGIHAIELQALADKTGGKLYHGADEDMSKVVTDGLFQETVDYTKDSNSDGL